MLFPSLLEPRVDEHYDDECYVWYRLVAADGGLEIEQAGEEWLGEIPEWWEEDLGNGSDVFHYLGEGCRAEDILTWALREGLMPEQLFAVRFSKPQWYKSGWEVEEWDFDLEVEIVRREAATTTLRDLEQVIAETFTFKQEVERERQAQSRARWAASDRWFLVWGSYWPGDSYLDDMCPPHGVTVGVYSTLIDVDAPEQMGYVPLAWGRSDNGKHDEALLALLAKVVLESPNMTLDKLKGLPSRWQ